MIASISPAETSDISRRRCLVQADTWRRANTYPAATYGWPIAEPRRASAWSASLPYAMCHPRIRISVDPSSVRKLTGLGDYDPEQHEAARRQDLPDHAEADLVQDGLEVALLGKGSKTCDRVIAIFRDTRAVNRPGLLVKWLQSVSVETAACTIAVRDMLASSSPHSVKTVSAPWMICCCLSADCSS